MKEELTMVELLTDYSTAQLETELKRRKDLAERQGGDALAMRGANQPLPPGGFVPWDGVNPPKPQPIRASTIRGDILRTAADLTEGDRNAAYGDPQTNLGCQGALEAIITSSLRDNGKFYSLPLRTKEALSGTLSQIAGKLARIVCGDPLRHDNFVDGAAYFAIAGEVASRAATEQNAKAAAEMKPGEFRSYNPSRPRGFA